MTAKKPLNALGERMAALRAEALARERNSRIEKTAKAAAKLDHERLAWVAAYVIDELATSERAVRAARFEAMKEQVAHSGKLATAYTDFFDLIAAPGLRGYLNVRFKLKHDPKQAAKANAKTLWLERRAGKHPKLRRNWQFSAECVKRWPVLTSPAVVEGWCTKWEKEARLKSQPAS